MLVGTVLIRLAVIQWYVIFLMLLIEAGTLLLLIVPLPLSFKRSVMKLLT